LTIFTQGIKARQIRSKEAVNSNFARENYTARLLT
jgi:hypothetical protein